AETFKRMREDARALGLRQLNRAIDTAAVDHDAFVAKCEAVDACDDIGRFVLADDDRAQPRHPSLRYSTVHDLTPRSPASPPVPTVGSSFSRWRSRPGRRALRRRRRLCRSAHDSAGRMSGHQLHKDHLAAFSLDEVPPDNL